MTEDIPCSGACGRGMRPDHEDGTVIGWTCAACVVDRERRIAHIARLEDENARLEKEAGRYRDQAMKEQGLREQAEKSANDAGNLHAAAVQGRYETEKTLAYCRERLASSEIHVRALQAQLDIERKDRAEGPRECIGVCQVCENSDQMLADVCEGCANVWEAATAQLATLQRREEARESTDSALRTEHRQEIEAVRRAWATRIKVLEARIVEVEAAAQADRNRAVMEVFAQATPALATANDRIAALEDELGKAQARIDAVDSLKCQVCGKAESTLAPVCMDCCDRQADGVAELRKERDGYRESAQHHETEEKDSKRYAKELEARVDALQKDRDGLRATVFPPGTTIALGPNQPRELTAAELEIETRRGEAFARLMDENEALHALLEKRGATIKGTWLEAMDGWRRTEKDLEACRTAYDRVAAENDHLRAETERAGLRIGEQIARLKEDAQKLQNENTELRSEVIDLREARDAARSFVDKMRPEADAADFRLATVENRLNGICPRLARVEAAVEKLLTPPQVGA